MSGAGKRSFGGAAKGGRGRHGKGTHSKGKSKSIGKGRIATYKREQSEIEELKERIKSELPEAGSQDTTSKLFSDLPLSRYTLGALQKSKFTDLTEIQRAAIPHALAGRDVLGAAKTGSGKTLAFLVPVLERLYHERWAAEDGLAALVISPTRELAMQIMQVLRQVGAGHRSLAAGLVTGGISFLEEQKNIRRMSILVATPGRLVQHLEQTPGFGLEELRVLVLDEADRLLDMGFKENLNAILEATPGPPQRQTLLFSATQTRSVQQLARLSLTAPQFVAVHDKAEAATPRRLAQAFVVCPLGDKVNLLWSFLKSHLRHKTIIFVSSCKQARFLYETVRRMRPGVPVMELHGRIQQQKRVGIYKDFLAKKSAALFATDVVARGLDFPSVDWVLQLDCPEDVEAYIHRVGRTARFRQQGHGLLVLLPSEAPGMVPKLRASKIPVKKTAINPDRAVSVVGKVAAEVAADAHLKHLAQRAFASYVRSVVISSDKEVFRAEELPLDELAASYGLPSTPKVRVPKSALDREAVRAEKNKSKQLKELEAAMARAKEERKKRKAAKRMALEEGERKGAVDAEAGGPASGAGAGGTIDDGEDSASSDPFGDSDEDSDELSSDEEDEEEDEDEEEKEEWAFEGGGGMGGVGAAGSDGEEAEGFQALDDEKLARQAASTGYGLTKPQAMRASDGAGPRRSNADDGGDEEDDEDAVFVKSTGLSELARKALGDDEDDDDDEEDEEDEEGKDANESTHEGDSSGGAAESSVSSREDKLRKQLLAGVSLSGMLQRERKKLLAATEQTIEMRRQAEAAARGETSMGLRRLAAQAAAEAESGDGSGEGGIVKAGGVVATEAPPSADALADRLSSLSSRLHERLKEADVEDRRAAKERVKAKHRREKMLARGELPSDDEGELGLAMAPRLPGAGSGGESDDEGEGEGEGEDDRESEGGVGGMSGGVAMLEGDGEEEQDDGIDGEQDHGGFNTRASGRGRSTLEGGAGDGDAGGRWAATSHRSTDAAEDSRPAVRSAARGASGGEGAGLEDALASEEALAAAMMEAKAKAKGKGKERRRKDGTIRPPRRGRKEGKGKGEKKKNKRKRQESGDERESKKRRTDA